MDPLQEYNSIILNRQRNPLDPSEYGEVHHIIPRSCGGCNEDWNLVRLTPEEHFRCHSLLPFIYAEGQEHLKMVRAFILMSGKGQIERTDADAYGKLRREYSEMLKGKPAWNKGLPSPLRGRNLLEDTKQKISHTLTGHGVDAETRRKISESHKGRKLGPHSDETRRKISEANKGKSRHPGYWKGKHLSEEYKMKLSAAKKGKRLSEETRRKMSEARKRYLSRLD